MSKSLKYLTGTALIVTVVAISAFTAFADYNGSSYPGFGTGDHAEIHEEMEAFHNQMEEALDNNDYAAWSNLIKDNGRNTDILETINQDNFEELVEAHRLMEQSRKIMEELGLSGQHHRMGLGMGPHMMGSNGGNFGPQGMGPLVQ